MDPLTDKHCENATQSSTSRAAVAPPATHGSSRHLQPSSRLSQVVSADGMFRLQLCQAGHPAPRAVCRDRTGRFSGEQSHREQCGDPPYLPVRKFKASTSKSPTTSAPENCAWSYAHTGPGGEREGDPFQIA